MTPVFLANIAMSIQQAVLDRDYKQALLDSLWLAPRMEGWLDRNMVKGNPENVATCRAALALVGQVADPTLLQSAGRLEPVKHLTMRLRNVLVAAA